MSKKDKISAEAKNWHKFHIPGMSYINRVKKNAIFIHQNADVLHERAKFEICFILQALKHRYITEAEEIIDRIRYIRDVVDLTTGMRFEVETTDERAKRFDTDPMKENITVIRIYEMLKKTREWDKLAPMIWREVKEATG